MSKNFGEACGLAELLQERSIAIDNNSINYTAFQVLEGCLATVTMDCVCSHCRKDALHMQQSHRHYL